MSKPEVENPCDYCGEEAGVEDTIYLTPRFRPNEVCGSCAFDRKIEERSMIQLPAKIQNQGLTEEDLQILKNSKFKGFSDKEVAYCAKIVAQTNLSPFLNQIHFVRRVGRDGVPVITTQVGIDGFRLQAQRTSGYAGSDEAVFTYDENHKENDCPAKATVTVYKMVSNQRCPFSATARWDEYYPSDSKSQWMWDKMPHGQLAKCAEALALRKAFPAELSSIYCDEEMQQAVEGYATEHPPHTDGFAPDPDKYVIPGGMFVKRGLHEIDTKKLADYITSREAAMTKNPKKPKPEWWDGFVERAEHYLASLEREPEEEELEY